jgi:glycosyltransferase involved in cell wall biosynthesis
MKVSVVTTLFNYRDYITPCIQSFLKQDFKDKEMIIVDDGSYDNPHEVIKKYESDNLKYIKLDQNYGYSYAKNVGIKACNGKILVMLDADDMLADKSLTIRYRKIKEGFDFVHGPVLDLRSSGELKQSSQWKKWKKCKKDASAYQFVHAQSVMLKKKIHRKVGLYDVTLRSKSDREMWGRIFNHGYRIGWVEDYVSIYRRHGRQMHRSKEKMAINDKLQKHVLKTIARRSKDLSDVELLEDDT